MVLHVAYCSKDKNRVRKDLPAIERHDSNRIDQVHNHARENGEEFALLSGKYELIGPSEEIPFYDELLREKNIPELITGVKNFLQTRSIEKVVYHTRKIEGEREQYYRLIKNACNTLGIEFEKKVIPKS